MKKRMRMMKKRRTRRRKRKRNPLKLLQDLNRYQLKI
jgi:hypothetical protein